MRGQKLSSWGASKALATMRKTAGAWGVGLTQKDGHSLNLCLGKTTKQRTGVQVEPTERHHTGSSGISITFRQQDLRADHFAYQHTLRFQTQCMCGKRCYTGRLPQRSG